MGGGLLGFPSRSWTHLLRHTESTLGTESLAPLLMAIEISWCSELPLSLNVHSTQPGLLTHRALYRCKHTAAVSSSSHGQKDRIFSSGKWEKQLREASSTTKTTPRICVGVRLWRHISLVEWHRADTIPVPPGLCPSNSWLGACRSLSAAGYLVWILLELQTEAEPSKSAMVTVFTGFTG